MVHCFLLWQHERSLRATMELRRNHLGGHRSKNNDAHGATAGMAAKHKIVGSIRAMKRESTTECSISNRSQTRSALKFRTARQFLCISIFNMDLDGACRSVGRCSESLISFLQRIAVCHQRLEVQNTVRQETHGLRPRVVIAVDEFEIDLGSHVSGPPLV